MGVTAEILRILSDGGKDVRDAIVVARAMECGDDARRIFDLVDELGRLEASPEVIAIAVYGFAESINTSNIKCGPHPRDSHTDTKDSNRSRRGMPDNHWRVLRQQIFDRDDYLCQYCGADHDLTCDHIIPLVRGGTNDNENLTTACRSCNSSKGDRLIGEWRR